MTDGNFTCALCGKQLMSEYEAVDHVCGQEPSEPTLADIPMTTREAVTVLANQMATLTEQVNNLLIAIHDVASSMRRLVSAYEQRTPE